MAYFEVIVHALWLWNFVLSLQIVDDIVRPLKICSANFVTVLFSKNNRDSKSAK